MDENNPEKYYDPEAYLLDEVGPAFRSAGHLDDADFYTILIWKAERAKTRHRERLKRIARGTFADAVHQIADELYRATDGKQRLRILMDRWEFLLPTASAILTILYPDEFTVFDWRVCDELKLGNAGSAAPYKPWCWRGFSEDLWAQYQSFKQAVIEKTPAGLSLRRKDRSLIGASIRREIEADCSQ